MAIDYPSAEGPFESADEDRPFRGSRWDASGPVTPSWSPAQPAADGPPWAAPAGAAASQDIAATCEHELALVRAQFNPSTAGGWGIIVDQHAHRWTAVRGPHIIVHAGSAGELCEKIAAGRWSRAAD